MKIIKQSARKQPKVSLILVDWSVRESFHLLHYLSQQTISRDDFEVIVIEYYSRIPEGLKKFEENIDTWVLLEMPEEYYYHKHLMYNAGIVFSHGEIITIGDFDAMVKPTFLNSIIKTFEENENIVLHLDQFRNSRRDLYPFCYPSFEEVLGAGCTNCWGGVTKGLAISQDPLHYRNYGACFCAKRKDLIDIGGADEHVDFVGHICGPYELTFRLINLGRREIWHQREFLYHTWHPGQAGAGNYLGPHDGRHMSTTALEALLSQRIYPHVMNKAIFALQHDPKSSMNVLIQEIINPNYQDFLLRKKLMDKKNIHKIAEQQYREILYKGYKILKDHENFTARPIMLNSHEDNGNKKFQLSAVSLHDIQKEIRIKKGKIPILFQYIVAPFFGIFYVILKLFYKILSIPRISLYILKRLYTMRFAIKEKKDECICLFNNLYLFKKMKLNKKICILTSNKAFFIILKFLGKVSNSQMEILYVSSAARAKNMLTQLDAEVLLFVPRAIYINFDLELRKRVKELVVI